MPEKKKRGDLKKNPEQEQAEYEDITAGLRATFKEEAYDLVTELEHALLELEKAPADEDLVGRVFRALHTIKGSGGVCGFHDVSAFAHELESVFDKVRKGKMAATKAIIDLTLEARDLIRAMFDVHYRGGTIDLTRSQALSDSLRKLLPDRGEKDITPPAGRMMNKSGLAEDVPGHPMTYRVRFRPKSDAFRKDRDPVAILNELRCLGQAAVIPQTDAIPLLEKIDAESCYLYWDVILTTNHGINAINDVFIFVKDECELKIEIIDEHASLDDEICYKRLGEILLERGDVTPVDLQKALKSKKRIGEVLVETGKVSDDKVRSALVEQQHIKEMQERQQAAEPLASIRVATEKLDDMVDLVGQLVTVQARLSQTVFALNIPELFSIAEEVERLTADLRDKTMSARMLPIGTTFSRFKRLVRDLSQKMGKEIELVTEGAETELDKTVIERLSDPLIHLIRNSIDHGVEPPAVRMAAGKPKKSAIRLSAVHSGAHVLIQIADDGAGLNTEAIRAKAIEKGLISADTDIPAGQLFSLILTPGFSTARQVTKVSGRGVGMDVVKRAIDGLQGSIGIESEKGEGAVITLRLPLTLAIIDGFITKIGAESFVFPLSIVEECIELTRNDVANSHGRNLAHVRGEIVPYIRLRERFTIHGEPPAIEQIVIVNDHGARVGFVVDTIIGGHQTVIKNLGRFYRDVEGVSGATILGDGTVALILDIPKLIRSVEKEEVS